MRGQEHLIAMRRGHRVPAEGVGIEVTPDRGMWPRSQEEADGSRVRLTVDPGESVDRLDLRCVVGLEVVVFAYSCEPCERAVRALCAACVAAGAKVVIGLQFRDSEEPVDPIIFTHGTPMEQH